MSKLAPRPALNDPATRPGCAFRLALLAVTWLLLELLSLILFRLVEGHSFSFAELQSRRQRITGATIESVPLTSFSTELDPTDWRSAHMLHPFVGFVRSPNPLRVNDYGFFGPSPIVDGRAVGRDGKRLLVAVVGGSFAAQLAMRAGPSLAAALAAAPRFRGREVLVFNLAIGGMKQPQQLATITYFASLGAEFDLVVNVDGYNELKLAQKNLELGVFPFYSGLWHFHLAQLPDPEVSRLLGRKEYLADFRRGLAALSNRLAWSPLTGLLWTLSDRQLAARSDHLGVAIDERIAFRARGGTAELPAFLAGPPYRGRDEAQALGDFVAVWARSSDLLRSFVESRGGEYFHFLQPNQYVAESKPMSPSESELALADPRNEQVVTAGYPRLRASGAALAANGLRFTDLTQIFREHPETLYIDSCCHLNAPGYALTADAIAAVIARDSPPN